jgi:hypothetical protein
MDKIVIMAVNGIGEGQQKAVRRCGARRCVVDHARERKKKIFFSSSGSCMSA